MGKTFYGLLSHYIFHKAQWDLFSRGISLQNLMRSNFLYDSNHGLSAAHYEDYSISCHSGKILFLWFIFWSEKSNYGQFSPLWLWNAKQGRFGDDLATSLAISSLSWLSSIVVSFLIKLSIGHVGLFLVCVGVQI